VEAGSGLHVCRRVDVDVGVILSMMVLNKGLFFDT